MFPASSPPYLAVPLEARGLTLQKYLDGLHSTITLVLEEFGLEGSVRPDLPGVFSGPARIATVGVAVSRLIAYHGLTLNVGPYLELFDVIDEPGIGNRPLRNTSMEARRQRYTAMSKVREALIRSLEQVFGLEQHHVFTNHPLIRPEGLLRCLRSQPRVNELHYRACRSWGEAGAIG